MKSVSIALVLAASLQMGSGEPPAVDREPIPPLTIEEIFRGSGLVGARSSAPGTPVGAIAAATTEIAGMVATREVTPEVLIMRRNEDGTYSRACVDSAAAARAFFAAANVREHSAAPEK